MAKFETTGDVSGRLHLWVFWVSFVAVLLLAGFQFPGGDGRYYAALTRGMSWTGSLNCTGSMMPRSKGNLFKGKDGEIYTKYPPGQSLVQLPMHFLFAKLLGAEARNEQEGFIEVLSLRLTQAIVSALTVMMLYLLLTGVFGYGAGISMVTVGVFLLATQFLFFTKSGYTEGLQSLLLVTMAYWVGRCRANATLLMLVGMGVLLVLTKPSLLVCALPVGVYVLQKGAHQGHRKWAWMVGAIVVGGGASFLMYYNYLRTGSLLDAGYGEGEFRAIEDPARFFETLLSIVASPQKSFFLYNPILIVGIPGLFLFRDAGYRRFFLLLLGMLMILYGLHGVSWSGHYGQRYLSPMIVLGMPFFAATLEKVAGLRWTWRAPLMAVISPVFLLSLYIAFLGVYFFEFTTINFCNAYDRVAQAHGIESCGDSVGSSSIGIRDYLLRSGYEPGRKAYEEFYWLDHAEGTTTVATKVMRSPYLASHWIQRDMLFFEPRLLKIMPAFQYVRWGMFLFGLLVMVGFGWRLWRLGRQDASKPMSQ